VPSWYEERLDMRRTPLKNVAFLIDGEKHELDQGQLAKLNSWLAELADKIDEKHRARFGGMVELFNQRGEVYCGVTGGNLTYSITPTSIGTVFKVVDSVTAEKVDLTNYDNW
jgi:hypothetical protein